MSTPGYAPTSILESNQPLSQSLLWQLQRNYFAQQGVNAWKHGAVPHYITSNPFIANAYAKVVFGFLRDWQSSLNPNHPIYILELGAGCGRFAYHFLKKFWSFFPHSTLKHLSVKYVLTDFSESNLHHWRTHPFLQPYFQQGILDLAHFDAQQEQPLHLHFANQTHTILKNPLIVLGNYFFDTLPQDTFTITDHQLHASLVTLSLPDHLNSRVPSTSEILNHPDLIHDLRVTYTDRPITPQYYDDPAYNQILQDYQQHLTDTTLLFPIVGLNCIRNLRRLSQDRLLLLSGDKAYSRLEDLRDCSKPYIAFHGDSFSLMVNFHAIGQYMISQGGQVLQTDHHHASLNIAAFLLGHPPTDYAEIRHAYQDAIASSSPDDFFTIKRSIERNYSSLSLQQLIAYLRLSGWDAHIFLDSYPALMSQIEYASGTQQQELIHTIEQIWDTYYHIGDFQNLAFNMGKLLSKTQAYDAAITYFQQSLKLNGIQPTTLYHLGLCYFQLKKQDAALYCIHQALSIEPTFTDAQELLAKIRITSVNSGNYAG